MIGKCIRSVGIQERGVTLAATLLESYEEPM